MSIQIEVPFDALQQPGVAKALAELMVSLGGHGGTDSLPAPAPVAARATRKSTPRGAKAKGRPRKAARKTTRSSISGTSGERWQAYLSALPEASRKFLNLLEARGTLSVDEAVRELGLKSSKAMGGLTGAMARWAPSQGVELPFEKSKDANGNRCWIWTRT